MHLTDNFKISTAKELTMLAIEHGLINKCSEEAETAEAICTFFNTIIDNLEKDN